jgi:Ca2+-binding RTX toxin-like protein
MAIPTISITGVDERGDAQDNDISGTGANDKLLGALGDDVLNGLQGNDHLGGGVGNDTLRGGGGDDLLYGGDGDDKLYGGSGDDYVFGGAGNDRIEGGSGDDYLSGGSGSDTFVFFNGFGNDIITDFDIAEDSLVLGGNNKLSFTYDADTDTLVGTGLGGTITFEGISDADAASIEALYGV